jgi:hypothetical protein
VAGDALDGRARALREVDAAVERLLGAPVVAERAVAGGFTYAANRVVGLADGRSVFVKAAADEVTHRWLRAEHRIYEAVDGPFLPRCLGWADDGVTVLVLEDLSAATWPPPWPDGGVEAVLAALDEVHAMAPPAGLPPAGELDELRRGWQAVADDPEPFLRLAVCSPAWLGRSLPALLDAAARAPLDGDALVHADVYSGNLCLRGGRCVLVDWSAAGLGHPLVDRALWLPSLHLEGGPPPDELTEPGMAGPAAAFAGYLAGRAGRPEPPTVPPPGVRGLQLALLGVALPWAARLLGLPEP